jgi:hypothetical protein
MYGNRFAQKNVLIIVTLLFVAIFIFIIVKSYKISKTKNDIDSLPTIKSNVRVIKTKNEVKELKVETSSFYESLKNNQEEKKIKIVNKNKEMATIDDNFVLDSKINKIVDDDAFVDNNGVVIDENIKEIVINEKTEAKNTDVTNREKKTIGLNANNYYKAQLIALKNQQQAKNFVNMVKKMYGSLLKNLDVFIVEIDLMEKGVFYRVQVGNFNTKDDATDFCRNYLKDNDKNITNCIVVK